MILITGSSGLIGRALAEKLTTSGIPVREFDIARSPDEDTRNPAALAAAVEGVEGVIHLAAVSRVVWAQRDPQLTQAVNVDALTSLMDIIARQPQSPWLTFASSREVYGEAARLPVAETALLNPLNVYARSKVAGEQMVERAREAGILTNVVRFSNVYGHVADHPDRVVTAFARSAAQGGKLRLEGPENMFDFTHIDDVARGMLTHIEATRVGEALPPIHFVTGTGTTLHRLAQVAMRIAHTPLEIEIAPSRSYDVARFVGDAERAREILGWKTRIDIESGFTMLAKAFRSEAAERLPPAQAETAMLASSGS